MEEKLHFYKKNVPYVIAVRMHLGDYTGRALTDTNPYVVVQPSQLRDFKRANKIAINEGMIIETTEPDWDEESPNVLEDEKAAEIVKNVFALKKALATYTSEVPLRKLLEQATLQKRPEKTINLIKDRLIDIVGDDEEFQDEIPAAQQRF